jgi:bifunctional ADP-heptose synthase (sugar kinase/adenylyltransferase)
MSELPTQTIERSALQKQLDQIYSKIVSPSRAIYQARMWQAEKQKVAVIDTVFDLPTYLHKEYSLAVKQYCDKLICRIDTDEHVKEKKGQNKPYINLENRQKETAHSPYIDLITTKSQGGTDWIKYFQPNIIVKSTTSGAKLMQEIEELELLAKNLRLDLEIIILDENCELVERSEALLKAIEYDNTKYREDRFSGSVIAKKIQDGFVLDNQSDLTCDI